MQKNVCVGTHMQNEKAGNGMRHALGIDGHWLRHVSGVVTAALALVLVAMGTAAAQMGQPADGQMVLQLPATPIAEEAQWFYDYVTAIIVVITLFVLALLLYVIFRHNARANPTPAKFSHNTLIEVAWTVIPVLILVAIGIFSFKLLYMQYTYPPADLTIKSTANAWFWEHEYPDEDGLGVTQNMVRDSEVLEAAIGADEFAKRFGNLEGLELQKAVYEASLEHWAKMPIQRQLAVDNPIAVPVNKVVHVLVTSNDVIHGWAMPSFGSRVQAVPGRITATWFKATKTGAFYGQCSVLCGAFHASMPIGIHVVEEPVYQEWLAAQKAGDSEAAKKILFDALPNSDTAKAVASSGRPAVGLIGAANAAQ